MTSLEKKRFTLSAAFIPTGTMTGYACLVAATVFTLLVTLVLTFTTANASEKQEQLQRKHITRP